jgi:hypothetical protein
MIVLALGLIASIAQAAPSVECKAIYRTLDEKRRSIEKEVPMPVVTTAGTLKKYSADLEGRHFSLIAEEDTLLAQITVAPEYTKGIVSRGLFDKQGSFNLTDVIGPTIYRIECRQGL